MWIVMLMPLFSGTLADKIVKIQTDEFIFVDFSVYIIWWRFNGCREVMQWDILHERRQHTR